MFYHILLNLNVRGLNPQNKVESLIYKIFRILKKNSLKQFFLLKEVFLNIILQKLKKIYKFFIKE